MSQEEQKESLIPKNQNKLADVIKSEDGLSLDVGDIEA